MPARHVPIAVRVVLGLSGAFAVMIVLGYLTTFHYDRAIGRSREFSGEGFGTWLEFGLRSLVGPVLYTMGLFVIVHVFGALWHFVRRFAPPVRRLSDHARTSLSGSFGRIAGTDGASIAQGLLLAQMLTFVGLLWGYWNLLALLPLTVNDVDAAALSLLDPASGNDVLFSYPLVISLLIATVGISWYSLLRRPHLRATVPPASIAAAVGLTAVMVLMIAVPDRLLYKSVAPEVLYRDQRCFLTGTKGDECLLYCPGATGVRTPVGRCADVSGKGTVERSKIFAPAQAPAAQKQP